MFIGLDFHEMDFSFVDFVIYYNIDLNFNKPVGLKIEGIFEIIIYCDILTIDLEKAKK